MKQPFRCPICDGKGVVPNGFYNVHPWSISSTSVTQEPCRSCANGIIWADSEVDVLKESLLKRM